LHFFDPSNLAIIPRFAVVLGIMVVVHELGHFIAAKLCGVRVEAFAIGFGKRLFGFVHNGTDYRVNLLPIGGYVMMAGVGDEPVSGSEQKQASKDPGELQNHPRWQRTIIALAGPVANFILAFALMAGLYMFDDEVPAFFTQPAVADYVAPDSQVGHTGMRSGDRVVYFDNQDNPTWADLQERAGNAAQNLEVPFSYIHDGQRVDSKIFVENKGKREDFDFEKLGLIPIEQTAPLEVSSLPDQTTPAAKAGLQPHDRIAAIDDQHPHSVQAIAAYLQVQKGKPAQLTILRTPATGPAQTIPVTITPYLADTQDGKAFRLGFANTPPPVTVMKLSFEKALALSWTDNLKNSKLIFDVLHRLFTRQVSVKSLSSPVGMAVQVNQAFEAGSFPLIATMAMISLNLGIFNLLPIPILDGGMIVFLMIESLMRRDLNQALKERVYQVAFVCLVLFAAVVIFNDISKLIPMHLKT
jgi:regulator of sigma E protease